MKKYISICLLLFLAAGMAKGQSAVQIDTIRVYEKEPVWNIIRLSPFHFIEGTFHLTYETFLSEKASLSLSAGITSRQRWNQTIPDFGFQEELQYRFYVLPPKNTGANGKNFFYFKGIYAGPFLAHRFRQQSVREWDWVAQEQVESFQNVNEFSGGVMLGVQMAFGNVLYLDVFTGGGMKKSIGGSSNQFLGPFQPGYNGVIPRGGIQLGIGF